MPELPEVETVARTLDRAVADRAIVNVRLGAFTGCISGIEPEAFRRRLIGQRIIAVGRRGKYVLVRLASGDLLTVHLRMTGELTVTTPDAPSSRHHHVTFTLDDGREIRFSDVRKFGRLRLLAAEEASAFDAALGPEPLDGALDAERFHALLAGRARPIKSLLLDQTFLAGVGNIYADEALFLAGIHPLRPARSLTLEESGRLLAGIREVLAGAVERGGTTLRNYRDGLGRPGTNQHHLRIYDRQAGDPCPRCGAPIERLVVGQRGTRLCPSCQPLPEGVGPVGA